MEESIYKCLILEKHRLRRSWLNLHSRRLEQECEKVFKSSISTQVKLSVMARDKEGCIWKVGGGSESQAVGRAWAEREKQGWTGPGL